MISEKMANTFTKIDQHIADRLQIVPTALLDTEMRIR